MHKKLKFILIGIPVFLFIAIPIYASSSTFLPKAQKWVDNNCSRRSISNQDSVLCFLFDKSKETDTRLNTTEQNISNINNTIATFSGIIKPPPSFRTPPDFVLTWGSSGGGPGELNAPEYIATNSAPEIFVSDSGNNRIQVFDSNGSYLRGWGSLGSGNGQFNHPKGIAVDTVFCFGVYVVDSGNHRVQRFSLSGIYSTQFGSEGTGNGQFSTINDIASNFTNQIYTVEDNRVQVFDCNGNYQKTFNFGGNSIKVDKNGQMYIADLATKNVRTYDINGNQIRVMGPLINGPYGIAADTNGAVYSTEWGSVGNDQNTIKKYFPSGALVATFGGNGSGPQQFSNPYGVAIDTFGKIYIVDKENNRIQKFSY